MKKVFLLGLLLCSAIGMNAQVRIGGDTIPHAAAILDLNANNDSLPAGNKGGLALPRVSLAGNTAQLNNTVPANGMMVYNTGGVLEAGIYYWNGTQWMKETENSAANLIAPLITWVPVDVVSLVSAEPRIAIPINTGISVFGTDTCALVVGSIDAIFFPGNDMAHPVKATILPPDFNPGSYATIPDGFNRNDYFVDTKTWHMLWRDSPTTMRWPCPQGPLFLPYLFWRKHQCSWGC